MSRTCMIFLALLLGSTNDLIAQSFSLEDGDRVVFLGNTFFERALDYGHLETMLTLHWPDRNVTFRNLGWDGDTVYGHSRAGGRRRAVFGDVVLQHLHEAKLHGIHGRVFLDEGIEAFSDRFGIDLNSFEISVVGLRLKSEHEDECCVTIDLQSVEAKGVNTGIKL